MSAALLTSAASFTLGLVEDPLRQRLFDDFLHLVAAERIDPYVGARWLWRLGPPGMPFALLTSAWVHRAWSRDEIEMEIVYEARVFLRRQQDAA
jgi:hypothetical protein